jgi:hypothetical protein
MPQFHAAEQRTVVEISLEDDQVGLGQVLEEIGSLRVQVPEGVSGAPEGVGFVPPLALLFVLLPSVTHRSERVPLSIGGLLKELSIDTRVEDPTSQIGLREAPKIRSPVPIPLGDVRDEPRDLLSVEDDLGAGTRLNEPVGVYQITVKLET